MALLLYISLPFLIYLSCVYRSSFTMITFTCGNKWWSR